MKGRRQRYNEEKLQQFIDRLGVETIEVDDGVARKYAKLIFDSGLAFSLPFAM